MGVKFRSSREKKRTLKVLAYGVTNAGKSYFGFSAPKPIVLNAENRVAPGPFAEMDYPEIIPSSVSDYRDAIAEIAAGRVPGDTVVLDSLQKPYDAIVQRYSRQISTDKGNSVSVDFVSVNRVMNSLVQPLCAIPEVNVVAIARQAVRLERQGNDFRRNGVKMTGDERWWYEFDYVLHFTARGVIGVEKSMSEHLPVGVTIHGDLDWERFVRLVDGSEKLAERVAPRAQAASAKPGGPAGDPADQDTAHRVTSQVTAHLAELSDAQREEVSGLARARRLSANRLLLLARSVSTSPIVPAKYALLRDVIAKEPIAS